MTAPELLMPAGDIEKMKYAFAFGADAVYLGVPKYSLRARENGYKNMDVVAEAVNYAHARGKKVYVTANIIPHNRKVAPFIEFVDEVLEGCKPDAWIMSDPGIIMHMREKHPEQVIHLSVQANTVNWASAKFWHKNGISRIILSRELSIKEIKQIKDHCPELELEAFIHGSICIAYSGRCLISNYMSSRDPNQGTCTNSCRWDYRIYEKQEMQPQAWIENTPPEEFRETQHGDSYVPIPGDYYLEERERPGEFMPIDEDENGTYLMNARDLCAVEYLKELYEAGIESFKVEGRTKSVYYAGIIARAYRRAIDEMMAGNEGVGAEVFRDIFSTQNRGFTAGFLHGNPGRSAQKMDKNQSENYAYQFAGIVREYDANRKMMKVEPRNPLHIGEEIELCIGAETKLVTISKIVKENGEEVSEIHGGLHFCWIPIEEDPGEFALLRKQIREFSLDLVQLSRPSMAQ